MIYRFTCKTGHSEWLPTCLRECLSGVGKSLTYCANGDFFYRLRIKFELDCSSFFLMCKFNFVTF